MPNPLNFVTVNNIHLKGSLSLYAHVASNVVNKKVSHSLVPRLHSPAYLWGVESGNEARSVIVTLGHMKVRIRDAYVNLFGDSEFYKCIYGAAKCSFCTVVQCRGHLVQEW